MLKVYARLAVLLSFAKGDGMEDRRQSWRIVEVMAIPGLRSEIGGTHGFVETEKSKGKNNCRSFDCAVREEAAHRFAQDDTSLEMGKNEPLGTG